MHQITLKMTLNATKAKMTLICLLPDECPRVLDFSLFCSTKITLSIKRSKVSHTGLSPKFMSVLFYCQLF